MTVYIYPHSGSVDDDGGAHRYDVFAHDKVGNFIKFGRFPVDNHQTSAVSFGKQGKTGRRPYHQRRTHREEKITVKTQLLGTAHLPLRHRLPEGDRRGLDVAAAVRAVRRAFVRI